MKHTTAVVNFGTREDFWKVLVHVNVGEYELHLRQDPGEGRFFLQIQFEALDNDSDSGKLERQFCRKWYLSPHMTKSELVRTAYKAYMAAVEHEACEKFKYHGESIYNPHVDVDALLSVSKLHNARPGH